MPIWAILAAAHPNGVDFYRLPVPRVELCGTIGACPERRSHSGKYVLRPLPKPLLIPFVILATAATIIASQAIITGAFSMTRQAIQLGWLPRLRIKQTSALGYGQIYIGVVNWVMMAITIGLTLVFEKSDNLAAAYGIAVSATMLMTSVLLFIAMVEKLTGAFRSALQSLEASFVDAAFLIANSAKIDGGRLYPDRSRDRHIRPHVDLAFRAGCHPPGSQVEVRPNRHFPERTGGERRAAGAWHGGIFDTVERRRAACDVLAPQA